MEWNGIEWEWISMWVKCDKGNIVNLDAASEIWISTRVNGFEIRAGAKNIHSSPVLYSNREKWKCEKFINFLFHGLKQGLSAIDMTDTEYKLPNKGE